MWKELDSTQKATYKKLMTNFASLSEAFAQKENDSSDTIIAPIIVSKFQETAFKRAFNATIEDIGNSSFDASINNGPDKKYLVGIKSFGVTSGYQKIAQFKQSSQLENWGEYINNIKQRGKDGKSKEDKDDYKTLAIRIAELRNKRIESSKSQLRGFKYKSDVEAVYHVLMPSKAIKNPGENDKPYIAVGETSYLPIDENKIKIEGPTDKNHLQNFRFNDGQHFYQYNSADSQLLMSFKSDEKAKNNESISVAEWPLSYVSDAFDFFANLHDSENDVKTFLQESQNSTLETHPKNNIIENSFTFKIKTEKRSGFNEWFSKSKSTPKEGETAYLKLISKVREVFGENSEFEKNLKYVLFTYFGKEVEKEKRESIRDDLTNQSKIDENLYEMIRKALWRGVSPYEVYIPVPNSKKFNHENPDFFKKGAGELLDTKLVAKPEDRSFPIKFIPSGEELDMILTQSDGKAIQSVDSQYLFGEWVLKNVFQLDDWELLTEEKLDELGINAMTFTKYNNGDPMTLEFTYVDPDNPPFDYWE
ncbi:hypothetical protein G6R29_05115 [Fructobacillus sp. M2-14]|uniref:Uncharacterized protein n=1 Tax=Fructobacillus broussonetiae TaxID=2713173 RepID=A0ABS5R364_9LACO|nr:hypothetical protein [Fructobacillus broussonetiae]MBS9338999.1 hypothetical protein [Fructobacillus broussonetiae]